MLPAFQARQCNKWLTGYLLWDRAFDVCRVHVRIKYVNNFGMDLFVFESDPQESNSLSDPQRLNEAESPTDQFRSWAGVVAERRIIYGKNRVEGNGSCSVNESVDTSSL